MKALFINGSPRKKFNTAQMLESAMKGAADAGAETEWINLFDYEFTGCRSCFALDNRSRRAVSHRRQRRMGIKEHVYHEHQTFNGAGF